MLRRLGIAALVLAVGAAGPGLAQTPSGAVAGFVVDPSDVAAAAVAITIVDVDTARTWNALTDAGGYFHVAGLTPARYRIVAEAAGFKRVELPALVEVGMTTTVELRLTIGEVTETVNVFGGTPLLRRDHHQVASVVGRDQIEGLPLNGRHFLELAKLEPGMTTPIRGTNNRTFLPVLGAGLPANPRIGSTRITADGGSISAPGTIGTNLSISPEAVQEFQLSTAGFDVATGMTTNGAVNIVTRSGGARPSGSGFFVHRDHRLAAHPGLRHEPGKPDPPFSRRQTGGSLGGPVRRDRAWFFAACERADQHGAVVVQPGTAEFASLGGIFPSPATGNQLTVRADAAFRTRHQMFTRHTFDTNNALAPPNERTDVLPSGWFHMSTRVNQTVAGVSSVLPRRLFNELRLSYYFVDSMEEPTNPDDCRGCFGLGAPLITIAGARLTFGAPRTVTFIGGRYQVTETVAWQKGRHTLRLGFDWEHASTRTSLLAQDPAQLTLWSPARVRQLAPHIPIPAAFSTLTDILRLPLQTFQTGVGPVVTPQRDFRPDRVFDLFRIHLSESWRAATRVSVNAGAAWTYEPNALNDDLTKPALLLPILGPDRLGPPPARVGNTSGTVGFAWTLSRDARTVLRAGVGRYFDPAATSNSLDLINERAALLPVGTSRLLVSGSRILWNGVPLSFTRMPTSRTGEQLLSILPGIRADLLGQVNPDNRDFSVRTVDATKQAMNLSDPAYTTPSAVHVNVGLERQLGRDVAVSADVVWRRFTNTFITGVDYNRWDSVEGPVIPECSSREREDVRAICSNGSITFNNTSGRARYKGLLIRIVKRLSNGWQFLGSYALGSYTGTNGTGVGAGFNNNDWLENDGPLPPDRRHIANVSGRVALRAGFVASFSTSAYSRPPFSAYVHGVDFNGDGTSNDLLPGTRINRFGRGLGSRDLRVLVEDYNARYGDRPTLVGDRAPNLVLPPRYSFGDTFLTQDVRVARILKIGSGTTRLQVFADVFNLFNTANLVEYGQDIANAETFGQPGARTSHVFGSGGPRAVQLGARVTF